MASCPLTLSCAFSSLVNLPKPRTSLAISRRRWQVFFISVDTLRAESLSVTVSSLLAVASMSLPNSLTTAFPRMTLDDCGEDCLAASALDFGSSLDRAPQPNWRRTNTSKILLRDGCCTISVENTLYYSLSLSQLRSHS